MRPIQRFAGRDLTMRLGVRIKRFGIRWFEPHATGPFNGPKQHLQHVQRPARLKAVGMCRNPAHGVKADRPPGHTGVMRAAKVGPRLGNFDRFVKGHAGQFRRHATYTFSRNANAVCDSIGRIVFGQIAGGNLMHHGAMRYAIARQGPGQVWQNARAVKGHWRARCAVNHQRLSRIIAQKQPKFR